MSDHLKLKLATALENVSELRSRVWQMERLVDAIGKDRDFALAERDAYRKAKAENDERFTAERDDAREKLRALVEAYDAANATDPSRYPAKARASYERMAQAIDAARGAL